MSSTKTTQFADLLHELKISLEGLKSIESTSSCQGCFLIFGDKMDPDNLSAECLFSQKLLVNQNSGSQQKNCFLQKYEENSRFMEQSIFDLSKLDMQSLVDIVQLAALAKEIKKGSAFSEAKFIFLVDFLTLNAERGQIFRQKLDLIKSLGGSVQSNSVLVIFNTNFENEEALIKYLYNCKWNTNSIAKNLLESQRVFNIQEVSAKNEKLQQYLQQMKGSNLEEVNFESLLNAYQKQQLKNMLEQEMERIIQQLESKRKDSIDLRLPLSNWTKEIKNKFIEFGRNPISVSFPTLHSKLNYEFLIKINLLKSDSKLMIENNKLKNKKRIYLFTAFSFVSIFLIKKVIFQCVQLPEIEFQYSKYQHFEFFRLIISYFLYKPENLYLQEIMDDTFNEK